MWNGPSFFHDEFAPEFSAFHVDVQDELAAKSKLIMQFGPHLGRPLVDPLKGSPYANMKELRFNTTAGVWRIAFAFDPRRQAVLLIAGNKVGINEQRFYIQLLEKADTRFNQHLKTLPKTL